MAKGKTGGAPQSTPIKGYEGAGGYKAGTPGGNLDKWNSGLPPGYKLTPRGVYTVNKYQPPPSIRPRPPQETPFISSDQMINNMPNSELLTPSERWLYNTLPRVMDNQVFGKPVGDWFEQFNEGWT